MGFKLITISFTFIVALVSVSWAYFRVLKIAKDKNLVDVPNNRKLQTDPVPFLGGIAVFIGVLMGILLGFAVMSLPSLVRHQELEGTVTRVAPALCSLAIMLYIGAMDDILGMSPKNRFIIEVVTVVGLVLGSGMCIDSFHGLWGIDDIQWAIAVPLTVFACVGIINAVNMIDGVNGLSSGLCLTCFVFYCITFTKVGDIANAVLAAATAGALIPFLLHNVFGKKSKMFIGDAGTMLMGMQMCWFTICMLSGRNLIETNPDFQGVGFVALALAIVCVPVFDTLRVMTLRIIHHRSPFSPDKTHLHHAFIQVGFLHVMTTLSEIFMNVAVVLIWALSVKLKASFEVQLYVVIASSVVIIWGTYAFLASNFNHNTRFIRKLIAFSPATHFGHKRWWLRLSAWLDAPEERLNRRLSKRKFL